MVRHGADPAVALAGVLELATEDIAVREGSASSVFAKANTPPTAVPSKPSPNTAVAAQTK